MKNKQARKIRKRLGEKINIGAFLLLHSLMFTIGCFLIPFSFLFWLFTDEDWKTSFWSIPLTLIN